MSEPKRPSIASRSGPSEFLRKLRERNYRKNRAASFGSRGSMAVKPRDLRQREAQLIAELMSLRAQLRKAGVDAQRSLDEAAATELRHGREMEAERPAT